MELQGRELRRKMKGTDVGILQKELLELGYTDFLQDKLRIQHFGAGTIAAVKGFQVRMGLEPTGIVDERTGRRINDTLREIGFVVRGIVQTAGGKPFTAGVVRAHDVDMRSEGLLGKALLEERDAYEIRYKRDQIHTAGRLEYDVACVRRRNIHWTRALRGDG